MHYDLPSLRALCELSRQKSFSEAATKLALTPSAFSRRIAKLELAVGQALVIRTTRSMRLTSSGKDLVARATPLIAGLDRALVETASAGARDAQQIVLGCAASVAYTLVPYALRELRRSFPDTRIKLTDGEGRRTALSLQRGEVDLAVTTAQVTPDTNLIIEEIATDAFVLVCSLDHPLAQQRSICWAELKDYRLLGFEAETSTRRLLESQLAQTGIVLSWFDEVRALSSLMGYLKAGSFAAPIPRSLAAHITDVAVLELHTPSIQRRLTLARHKDASFGPAAQTLWRALRICASNKPFEPARLIRDALGSKQDADVQFVGASPRLGR